MTVGFALLHYKKNILDGIELAERNTTLIFEFS